jgi:cyclic lactone autoinducer peptide
MMQFGHATKAALMVSLLAVSGCSPWFDYAPKVTSSTLPATLGTCPAKDLQYLVGKPRTALEVIRFGSTVRIEEPEQMNTQDYDGSRTRIVIGSDGKIARILCG